jgi:hypothetical protein
MSRVFKKKGFFRRRKFSKRQKFVITTIILTVGLVTTQLVPFERRNEMVIVQAIIAYFLSAWALRENLNGVEWFTLLILPTMYTASVSLFYFLLPVRWLTRLPTAAFFAVGTYALLLTENIYNVAAERSIQLVRAAHSIGLLLTLVTAFLLLNTILSFHAPFYITALVAALICFPLTLQSLWSMELTPKISSIVLSYSTGVTLVISQIVLLLGLWPMKEFYLIGRWPIKGSIIVALFLTSYMYTLIGLIQQRLLGRLFPEIVRGFVLISVIVFFILMATTKWN